jgi:predicted RNase H-like HicB family nuclease
MIKDKEYYLAVDYDIIVTNLEAQEGGGYFAYYKDISGVMGDGGSKNEVIEDVKNAFRCYLDFALKNKDSIPEPKRLGQTKKINISMIGDRVNNLDIYAKRLKTTRSGLLSSLTDKLLNGDIDMSQKS